MEGIVHGFTRYATLHVSPEMIDDLGDISPIKEWALDDVEERARADLAGLLDCPQGDLPIVRVDRTVKPGPDESAYFLSVRLAVRLTAEQDARFYPTPPLLIS